MAYFFEDLNRSKIPGTAKSDEVDFEDGRQATASKRETLELVKALHKISDPAIKRNAVKFLKSIANAELSES